MTHPTTPTWLQALADAYLARQATAFVLEGPAHELVLDANPETGVRRWLPLTDYLVQVLFAPRTLSLRYDRASGFGYRNPSDQARLTDELRQLGLDPQQLSRLGRSPGRAITLLDSVFANLLRQGHSLALVCPHAESLLLPDELATDEDRALRLLLTEWVHNRLWQAGDATVILLAERAADLPSAYTGLQHVRTLQIEPPTLATRQAWLADHLSPDWPESSRETLAGSTEGWFLFEMMSLTTAPANTLPTDWLTQYRPSRLDAPAHLSPPPYEGPTTAQAPWAEAFGREYAAHTRALFLFHGNVFDRYAGWDATAQRPQYRILADYLLHDLLQDRDVVLRFDRAAGLTFRSDGEKADFVEYLLALDRRFNTQLTGNFPREPAQAFTHLDRYLRDRMAEGRRMALVVEYADTIAPMTQPGGGSTNDRAVLVQLLKWANDPTFIRGEIAILLVAERLHDLHVNLTQSPFAAEVELPYPTADDRLRFIQTTLWDRPELSRHLEVPAEPLAELTGGLTLVHLNSLLAFAIHNQEPLTVEALGRLKKELIEREAGGLLTFVESPFTLDDVAGHAAAKAHLRHAARALRAGQLDVLPMGYLVTGPVGTGKTFLVSCYAGEIGVPMVEIKNFRSQWQGQTEANLERILGILKALSPVAVLVDEADAALGNRENQGDSGVGNRVFSMLASFMSQTQNRGRIVWFLLTNRPELMPVDLKRQGRAEEHIGLFYPDTAAEKRELLAVMLRKTKLSHLAPEEFTDEFFAELPIRSGADMEAALTRAKFLAAARSESPVSLDHIQEAFADFIPPAYPDQIERQTLMAVLECTSRALLPEAYRQMSRETVVERLQELGWREG